MTDPTANQMTSFVVRFVRETSEEQGARWRGLIQHVQSGAEQNFATFAEAVRFMQTRVVEQTVQALEGGKAAAGTHPWVDMMSEMTKMWGVLGSQMTEAWTQTMFGPWGEKPATDQKAILAHLERLVAQIGTLAARIEELEARLEEKE